MARIIVRQSTDSTRVYGYVRCEVIGADGLVDDSAYERLPASVIEECREQHAQVGCRGANRSERRVVEILERLGHTVIDRDGDRHGYSGADGEQDD